MKAALQIAKGQEPEQGKSLEYYRASKDKYLALCRRYGLNPFDLDIRTVSTSEIPEEDKRKIVKLVLDLVRLERELKGLLGKGLFPLTVRETERSGYLLPNQR